MLRQDVREPLATVRDPRPVTRTAPAEDLPSVTEAQLTVTIYGVIASAAGLLPKTARLKKEEERCV